MVRAAVVRGLTADPRVERVLSSRNDRLAEFWLKERPSRLVASADQVTVIDAEDDFTAMLGHLLRSLGFGVTLISWNQVAARLDMIEQPAPLVLGPGPGDPADLSLERIAVLRQIAATRLDARLPTIGICLGHQILGLELGLSVRRLPFPDQGVQAAVRVFGQTQHVGFYNSFVLAPPADGLPGFTMDADDGNGRIVAMRGPSVAGLQFHPESVLTTNGGEILRQAVAFVSPELAAPR
jgi:phenazine biosynthesis protein phzE